MFQPIPVPSHAAHAHLHGSAQWTVTYPTLVAPRPLRPSAHAHYHPYHAGSSLGRGSSTRLTRVPPRLRVVPSPAEALARISLVDQPTPPPDVQDETAREFGTVSTLSSETLEEFLRILRGGGSASPVQTPETEAQPVILSCVVKSASPTDIENKRNPLATAPAAWSEQAHVAGETPNVAATPEPTQPMTAPVAPIADWPGRLTRAGPSVIRKRTRTQSQSPTRDRGRWAHPYRRETGPSRNGSEKSSRGNSFCESSIARPSRSASKRASAASWASSETDPSEPADLGSSQNEDVDVELASNRGDVDDEELLARSADTEVDSSTCEDASKTSARGRMAYAPASPISRRHTSNPLAHYSPILFETLAARARANVFSPSHSRSPSPTPEPLVSNPLDEEDEDADDADEYQPASIVRMEMPRSFWSPPTTP